MEKVDWFRSLFAVEKKLPLILEVWASGVKNLKIFSNVIERKGNGQDGRDS